MAAVRTRKKRRFAWPTASQGREDVSGELAVEVAGRLAALQPRVEQHGRGGPLVGLLDDVGQGEPARVHIVVLHRGGHVLEKRPELQGTQYPFHVLGSAQVVPGRAEVGAEAAHAAQPLGAQKQIAAARNRQVGGDRARGVAQIEARHRQRVDAIGALVVHPGRLVAIPVGQDAAAEQSGLRMRRCRRAHGFQIAGVHPVVIVDKGHQVAGEARQGAVQGVGLAWRGLGEPGQRQLAWVRRLLAVSVEQSVGAVAAGVGGDQDIDLAFGGAAGGIERGQGPFQQSGAVVGTDQDGQAGHAQPPLGRGPKAQPLICPRK